MSGKAQILGSAPLFAVKNIHRSVDYYCEALGFARPHIWGEPPFFAMPQRDGFIVMLSQVDEPRKIQPNHLVSGHWDAYFWVRDVHGLFEEFKRNGAMISYAPEHKQAYGNIEFAVKDPDDYLIAFAQEITDD